MADAALFAASHAKVTRAKSFISELDKFLAVYSAQTNMRIEPDAGGAVTVSFAGIGFTPSVIVGDCIHNLRSALDLMASELARMNGKSDLQVHFPFARVEVDLSGQIQRKHFHYCGQDAVDLLLTLAPYSGGNLHLRAIHDLDMQDKHRVLIPHKGSAGVQISRGPAGPVFTQTGFRFMFPAGTPLEGKPLVQTLEDLVRAVEGVLEAFALLSLPAPLSKTLLGRPNLSPITSRHRICSPGFVTYMLRHAEDKALAAGRRGGLARHARTWQGRGGTVRLCDVKEEARLQPRRGTVAEADSSVPARSQR